MKQMLFLENPPKGAVPVLGKPRRNVAASSRRTNTAKTGVAKMAKRKGRSAKRRNPVRARRVYAAPKRRYRRRRNPAGMSMGKITNTIMQGLVDAGYGVGGKAAAKTVSSMLGFAGGGPMTYLVQALVGIAGGMVVADFSRDGARAFVQGAFMCPIEELAVGANIPLVSAGLSGYNNFILPTAYNAGLLSPGPAVGMQGYPPAGFAGYPEQAGFGDFDSMAEGYGR